MEKVRHMRRLPAIVVALMVQVGGIPGARADGGEQLYFLAMAQRSGSLSSTGTAVHVYLRWGVNEGRLPADLDEFKLLRDGNPIVSVSAQDQDDTAAIGALYAPADQERRRLELHRWIDAEDPGTPVPIGNLAAIVAARIDPGHPDHDPVWAHFASRIDPNVAVARHRGFVDTGASPGLHDYELVGVAADMSERRLGFVQVDTSAAQQVAGPGGFQQVAQSRCDLTDRFRDHGVVALDWDPVDSLGTTLIDRFSASLAIAGYDLYRTTANVSSLPAIDIRSLALTQPHDAQGNVTLPGLEKVNDQPITVSGAAAEESGPGWNPPYAQHVETHPELRVRGVEPGDTRGYYLVPRDFTGNYGPTAGVLVTVPNRIRPPSPWNVSGDQRSGPGEFAVVWDHVDVRNFQGSHTRDRVYCNLESARFERRLEYVPAGESCDADVPSALDLDVDEYLVYRFEDWQVATAFKDSDGDGFADASERGPDIQDPGTVCDPGATPAGGTSHRVAQVDAATAMPAGDGRAILRYVDSVVSATPDTVYWYRVAAVSTSGELSTLSAPVRGIFRDRAKPQRDDLAAWGLSFTAAPACSVSTGVISPPDPGLPFAIDDTVYNHADRVEVGCGDGSNLFRLEVLEQEGQRGAELPASACRRFLRDCPDDVRYTFRDATGAAMAPEAGYPVVSATSCRPGQGLPHVQVAESCAPGPGPDIGPNDVVRGSVVLDVPGASACVTLWRDIGGNLRRLEQVCPGEWPYVLAAANLGGQSVCLAARIQNESNVVSTLERLPCYRTQVSAPEAPTPLELMFLAGGQAELSWLPSEQPTVGSIVEWGATGKGARTTRFVPHAGHTARDGEVTTSVPVGSEPAAPSGQEEWCFRLRGVGLAPEGSEDEALSAWSPRRCAERLAPGDPEVSYLPWPRIAEPPAGRPLEAFYLTHSEDGLPAIALGDSIDAGLCGASVASCDPGASGGACLGDSLDDPLVVECATFCGTLSSALEGGIGFVAYRQHRDGGGAPSEYAQVSPLIDRLGCQVGFRDPAGGTACSYAASVLAGAVPDAPFAIDATASEASAQVRMACVSGAEEQLLPVVETDSGVRGAFLSESSCRRYLARCPGDVVYGFEDAGGLELAGGSYPTLDSADCQPDTALPQVELTESCSYAVDPSVQFHRLRDPFLKLLDFTAGSPPGAGRRMVFVDRYPHLGGEGREYRYQLVYFDRHGEIRSHRTSNWVTAP